MPSYLLCKIAVNFNSYSSIQGTKTLQPAKPHLVLPLELGPHGAEGLLAARSGLDVVHDVHVDVVQVDVRLLRGGAVLVHDRAEDVPRLGAAHLAIRTRVHARGCVQGNAQ